MGAVERILFLSPGTGDGFTRPSHPAVDNRASRLFTLRGPEQWRRSWMFVSFSPEAIKVSTRGGGESTASFMANLQHHLEIYGKKGAGPMPGRWRLANSNVASVVSGSSMTATSAWIQGAL
ncbi:hypothetical protein COCON_G00133190 [Conger conger]|uniref:Uncharacterized protein n=1 Tax=Conger conger TaxID=82655 RepID=A0A9Q1DE97_CONCO|nr:hypothetical protein COCON_G00133190 [Conger conger]